MRRFLGIALFVVMLGLAWRIGSMLSSDAIGMAIALRCAALAETHEMAIIDAALIAENGKITGIGM